MLLIFIIEKLFLAFTIMLFIRILGSWLPELQGQRWMQFIAFYTDPYLNFFRKFIPPLGMIDFSPIIAFFCLGFIENALKYIVYQFLL
jgi:YggT family protein